MTKDENTPAHVFKKICNYWEIDFEESTLEFKSEFGSDFVYREAREKQIYTTGNPKGLFTTLMNSKGIQRDIEAHGLITSDQKKLIDIELMKVYNDINTLGNSLYSLQSLRRKNIKTSRLES